MVVLTLLALFLPAFLSRAYQVQEGEIRFYLHTRDREELQVTLKNQCDVDASKDFRFIIHGWIASHNESWVKEITEAYLNAGDFNVIHVDWSQLAAESADVAVANANDAAYYAAKFVRGLIKNSKVSPGRIQIVGHSLGAHISGFIGKYIKREFNENIGKIVALDPANVIFDSGDGLLKDDAAIVAVIHTDGGDSGKKDAFGTIDFFPNGGSAVQPGCSEGPEDCSHVIVTAFFVESIENPNGFLSTKCSSYEDYIAGVCDENDKVPLGGNLEGKEGSYFCETNPEKPYSKN